MTVIKFLISFSLLVLLFILNLYIGSVEIPTSSVTEILLGHTPATEEPFRFIILESRLPQAITALLAGAALTVSGLLLQTSFRNPLAGPSILGVTSGASLGVAIIMLFLGGSFSMGGYSVGGWSAILFGAFAGSIAIMGLLLLLSSWLKSDMLLLITGIMVGYLTSSVITLLNYLSTAEGIQSYTMWGMGNFNGVSYDQMIFFITTVSIGLFCSILLSKPLNAILLGENYAKNLGVNLHLVRNLLLITTGLLTAVITAFCGPVSFIGLAVPHIVRMIYKVADHRVIIPACILTGGIVALTCNLICIIPENNVLPLNGVTPLIGVPVILYVIFKGRKK